MMLALWNFLRGYVRIRVMGFQVERFLNMAAFRGIFMWDARRSDDGVELCVSVKGFKALRHIIRKTKCRVHILAKYGLPFTLHRHRRRKLLLAGFVFFVCAMYALSAFVWRIDIVGTSNLSHDEIHDFLAERGLRIGSVKRWVDHTALSRELLENFEGIGYANIHTRGTRTTVSLAEAIAPPAVVDRSTPTHVIAERDGLITNITAGAGAPLARAGDVVQAGEVLVSGMLQISPDDPATEIILVHAYAEVWARRYYPIIFEVPFTYARRVFTGRVANRHAVQLLFAGGIKLQFPRTSIPYTEYDRITTQHQPGAGGDFPLPVIWQRTRYAEFELKPRTRTVDQARELAERQLSARVLREFDFGIDIVEKRFHLEETPDALLVQALVITNERIDRQVPIGDTAWNPLSFPPP
jgi:similar to stage IV sporulation protein